MQLKSVQLISSTFLSCVMSGNHEYNSYDSGHIFDQNPSGAAKYVPSFSSSKNYGLVSQPLTLSHHRVNARSGSGASRNAMHSPRQWNQT